MNRINPTDDNKKMTDLNLDLKNQQQLLLQFLPNQCHHIP